MDVFTESKNMLKKISLALFLIALVSVASAFAQSVHTPEKGSAERAEIFNSLRIPVEGKLKQKVQFAAQTFNVQGNWAFVFGNLQSPSGGKLNYKGTVYQEAIDNGAFDDNFQSLLKKQGNKWRVVKYQIGCTDVCWIPWKDDYKAAKAVFPDMQ